MGFDTFMFDAKVLADAIVLSHLLDHVRDYSAAHSDVLDFSAFLAASNPSAHARALVHPTEDASGTFAALALNIAEAGASPHWVDIAYLNGILQGQMVNIALDAALRAFDPPPRQ